MTTDDLHAGPAITTIRVCDLRQLEADLAAARAEAELLRDSLRVLRSVAEENDGYLNGSAPPDAQRIEVAVYRLYAEAARLRELVFRALRIVLPQIGRGTCWCDVGIGSPMMTTHAPGCQGAQEWNRDAKAALEGER